MKKQHVFVIIALCLGILFTWGVLRVSASQAQPSALDCNPCHKRRDQCVVSIRNA